MQKSSFEEELYKELTVRVGNGGKETFDAMYNILVLCRGSDETAGDTGQDIVLIILETLNTIQDQFERMRLGTTLFGALYEDIPPKEEWELMR